MAQYITFASIPNTQPQAYYTTITSILAEVKRSSPTDKELKQFLKQRNLYDKATSERLLEILDIRNVGGRFILGEWAQKMLDAKDEQEFKEVLSRRLYELNPLMMKYCLVAMDTEHEGRLHSTNELFRMLTSYVYPGKKPILVDFKAYVDWGAAAGLWKMIGVRWGLGDVGKKMLEVVRRLDDDEFLEEEREEERGGEEEGAKEVEVKETEGGGVLEQKAVEATVEQERVEKAVEVEKPLEVKTEPQVAVAKLTWRRMEVGDRFRQEASEYLKRWFEKYPLREALSAQGLGLRKESPTVLSEAGFCALLFSRDFKEQDVLWALQFLSQYKIFAVSSFAKLPFERIAYALKQTRRPVAWFETLVYLPLLVGKASEVVPKALEAKNFKDFLAIVWEGLFEPFAPLAPFYFAKLLLDLGLLPEGLSRACFVPTLLVRENAFRIGLIEHIHAKDFDDLVGYCDALSEFFPKPYFETPLAVVKSAFGCMFDCPRRKVCECPCLEKFEVTSV